MNPINNTLLINPDGMISPDEIPDSAHIYPYKTVDPNKAVYITLRYYFWSNIVITNDKIFTIRRDNHEHVASCSFGSPQYLDLGSSCNMMSRRTLPKNTIPVYDTGIKVIDDSSYSLYSIKSKNGKLLYTVPIIVYPDGENKPGYVLGEYIKQRLGGSFKPLLDSIATKDNSFYYFAKGPCNIYIGKCCHEFGDSLLINNIINKYNNKYGDPYSRNTLPMITVADWHRAPHTIKFVTLSDGSSGLLLYVTGGENTVILKV